MRSGANPSPGLFDRRLEKPLIALQTVLDGEASAKRTEVRHPARPSLRAIVSMHSRHYDPFGQPGFLIEFAPAEPLLRSKPAGKDKGSFRTLIALERELVRLVLEGKSNKEIASATGRALGSVKNALHAVFGKLGVNSRGALIARVQRRPGKS